MKGVRPTLSVLVALLMLGAATLVYGGEEGATPEASEAEAFDLSRLPKEWRWGHVQEPIWQTQSFIVQAGLKNTETVLLVHGIDGGFTDWLSVIDDLANRYHVIAVDLPGFGRSQEPKAQLSPENYSKFLRWVANTYAKSSMVVIGHSMGASVSLQFAADNPTLVTRLVLVDAAGVLERTALMKESVNLPVVPAGMPESVTTFANKLNQFAKSLVEWTSTTPDPVPVVGANDGAWQLLFEGKANVNAALSLVMHDFSSALQKVEQPTWIIWGRKDAIAPLRTGRVLVGQLQHAELSVIDGAAHVPMRSHPSEFKALLQKALSAEPNTNKRFSKSLPKQQIDGDVLYCSNKNGVRYSGHYKAVFLDNCQDVKLWNLTANQMIIKSSQVSMINVAVDNPGGAAIQSELSIISMTNASLKGVRGIESDGTRWDLAGVDIRSANRGIEIDRRSRFIFSVSRLKSAAVDTTVHGVFDTQNRVLDYSL